MTTYEMALQAAKKYRKNILGELDYSADGIEAAFDRGYKLGAFDALKEIETRIEMGKHSSLQTAETILDAIKMTVKELKGE